MMNILFLIDKLLNSNDPTVGIAKSLVKEWKKSGHQVILAYNTGVSTSRLTETVDESTGCKAYGYYIPSEQRIIDFLSSVEGKGTVTRLASYALHPKLWAQFYDFYFAEYKCNAKRIARCVEQIAKKESIDMVYAIGEPHYTVYAVALSRVNARKRAYLVDPYSFNSTHNYARASKVEKYILEQLEKLYTTRPVVESYRADSNFSQYIDKTDSVEFPTLVAPAESHTDVSLGSSSINCVFAGNFFDGIRPKEPLMDLFAGLTAEPGSQEIALHIFGNGGQTLPASEVPAVLQQADVLINLGNTVTNMVPSKLFQCLAMGKPLVNICHLKSDPTLEYTSRYPMCLDLFVEDDMDENRKKLVEFCQKYAGKSLPYDEVRALYQECTPEYVAGRLIG